MLRKMTEEEIRIRKMENLRMVSLYEFTDAVRTSDAARAKKGGKPAGCTAITVLCDEGEQFTLSELDPYFEELAEQVMKLYEEAENRDSILMNPPTRAVLEAGITSGEEPFLKPFFELQGVRTPAIPFASRLGLRFLPLTVYLVNELEGLIGRNGTVVGQTVGWRGKAVLRLKVLRAITEHPVIIRQVSDGELRVSVGNYPRNLENLTMDIVVDAHTCLTGEIGLSGEIRPVNRIEQRISEAEKLGFKRIIIPEFKNLDVKKWNIEVVCARKVEEAFSALFG